MSRLPDTQVDALEIELSDFQRSETKPDQKQPQQPPEKVSEIVVVAPVLAPAGLFSKSNRSYDFLCKIILIGDSDVGKSELILRFTDDSYTTSFITPIGIDFKIKTVTMDNKRIKLQIWDTAGQERFRCITEAYYRATMGIMLVYSVTNNNSFQNIRNWYRQCKEKAPENVEFILIGSKCEDAQDRVVSFEQGQALAKELEIPFFLECSAKTNANIDEAFISLGERITQKLYLSAQNSQSIRLEDNTQPKENRCCK